jgi:hypothetical protein
MHCLFEEYLSCKGDWLESSIILNLTRKSSSKRLGRHMWRSRKWLQGEHGKELAEELIARKKALGDKSWCVHPDFPKSEAYADMQTTSSKTTNKQSLLTTTTTTTTSKQSLLTHSSNNNNNNQRQQQQQQYCSHRQDHELFKVFDGKEEETEDNEESSMRLEAAMALDGEATQAALSEP